MRICCTSNCFEPCVAASRERGTTRTPLCRKWGMSNNHWLDALQLECLVCVWMCLQRLQEAATSLQLQPSNHKETTKHSSLNCSRNQFLLERWFDKDYPKVWSQSITAGHSQLSFSSTSVTLRLKLRRGSCNRHSDSYEAVCLPFLPLGGELLHTNE